MSKHTPGPWTAEKRKDRKIRGWVIRAPGSPPYISYELASLSGYDPIRDKPNARLIAAAPELLEALREMVAGEAEAIKEADALGVPFPDEMLTSYRRAVAAIAKAGGAA